MRTTPSDKVVVIGAGVTGLTSALRLQENGFRVVLVAKDFPGPFETIDSRTQINFTSPWGGAHNCFDTYFPEGDSPVLEQRDHAFALTTYCRMKELHAAHPEAGITFTDGIEFFEDPPAKVQRLTPERAQTLGYEGFRLLPQQELPERVKLGYTYRTWCVNPMVYCSFLLRRFSFHGGKIVKAEVQNPAEVFAMEGHQQVAFVVNASGSGFGDNDVHITRGQTCLVANPCNVTISRHNADGTSTFCIPRNFDGGTIIGGTKDPGDWDAAPSDTTRAHLLNRLAETYPPILESGQFTVLRDIVGRRPTRAQGMRVEREELRRMKTVVHAYGAGGRGYELSWGVADQVMAEICG